MLAKEIKLANIKKQKDVIEAGLRELFRTQEDGLN